MRQTNSQANKMEIGSSAGRLGGNPGVVSQGRDSFAVPRYFYYLGCMTLCQMVIRPIASVTISDIFFLISAVMTIYLRLAGRRSSSRYYPTEVKIGAAAFITGGFLSTLFSPDIGASLVELLKYAYLFFVWLWLSVTLLDRKTHIVNAITFWAVSAAVAGAAALAQMLISPDIIPNTEPTWNRMTGTAQHMNDLGGLEAIALWPSIALITAGGASMARKAAGAVLSALILAGLLASVSLGGILAAAAAGAIYVVSNRSVARSAMLISLVAAVLAYTVYLQRGTGAYNIFDRIEQKLSGDEMVDTVDTRIESISNTWKKISEGMVVGHGLDYGASIAEHEMLPHNMFVQKWYQTGLFGLLGFILIFRWAVMAGVRLSSRRMPAALRPVSVSVMCSLIAFLVYSMGAPVQTNRYGWISIALIMALESVNRSVAGRRPVMTRSDG